MGKEENINPKSASAKAGLAAANGQALTRKQKRRVRRTRGIGDNPDIRYRGPLSYQTLRVIGWFCVALTVLGFGLRAIALVKPGIPTALPEVLTEAFGLVMPLFLLANFTLILSSRQSYKRLLIFYSVMVLVFAVSFYAYGERLLYLAAKLIGETPEERREILNAFANRFLYGGFNVFVDLLLCLLFFFFLNYEPKKFFQGKKKIVFRLFSLFVALYEVASIALKVTSAQGIFTMPLEVTPWLTTKPLMCLFAFTAITLFLKIREVRFLKHHGTMADYEKYLETNANSFQVGLFFMIVFFIASVADVALFFSMYYSMINAEYEALIGTAELTPEEAQAAMDLAADTLMSRLHRVGIGGSIGLFFVAPFCPLISYTRVPKCRKLDKFLPLIGIGVSALIGFEVLFFVLSSLAA